MAKEISRGLNVFLWIIQILLASSLIWAASVKLLQSPEELAKMWPWTAEHRGLVLVTGLLDMAGGLGLILPGIFRMNPNLTRISAFAIIFLMIAAGIFHVSRGETAAIATNLVFAAMAGIVAFLRRN